MLVFSPKRDWSQRNGARICGTGYSFIWISLLCSSTQLDLDPVQYRCNTSPLSQFFFTFYFLNFYFFLLLTFFLTFFNQWLRLKVVFYNYQFQPLIAIAPSAIAPDPNPTQLKLPGQNLFPNDNGIPDCFIIEFFRLPLFDFELWDSNVCYSEWLKVKSSYIQCHFLFQTLLPFFLVVKVLWVAQF